MSVWLFYLQIYNNCLMLVSTFWFSMSEIIQETYVWLHIVPLNHKLHGLSMQHFFVISAICQISMITMVVPYFPHNSLPVPPLLSFLSSAPPPLSSPIPPTSTPPPVAFSSLPACCWGYCWLTWLRVQGPPAVCEESISSTHCTHLHGCTHSIHTFVVTSVLIGNAYWSR